MLALLFLTVCGVTIGGLLTYSNSSSTATTALRTSRGYTYDAENAMQVAIATVRPGAACSSSGTTVYSVPTNSSLLNSPGRGLRVDCYGISSTTVQRNDVFSVCPILIAAPCPDAQSLLRASVVFYDIPSTGYSLSVQTWSNQ